MLYSSQQRLWDPNGNYLPLLAEDDWHSWPQIQKVVRWESTILLILLVKLLEKETNYLKTETEEKELSWVSACLLSARTKNWFLTINHKICTSLAKNSTEANNLWDLNIIPVYTQIKVYSFSKSSDKNTPNIPFLTELFRFWSLVFSKNWRKIIRLNKINFHLSLKYQLTEFSYFILWLSEIFLWC